MENWYMEFQQGGPGHTEYATAYDTHNIEHRTEPVVKY